MKFKKETLRILQNIKNLKVQGASKIALATADTFTIEIKALEKLKMPIEHFFELGKAFWQTRPTEPAMKHFIVSFYCELEKQFERTKETTSIKKNMLNFISTYHQQLQKDIDKIAEEFCKTKPKPCVIFTHCHSSIVEKAIKELHKKGRVKFVVNTETRPLFQGRITAKNLTSAGIKVRHIVDSGTYAYAKLLQQQGEDIIFLTGADVITNRGDLINKIGTSQISLCLNSLGIKHYVLTTSNKIDPVSKWWKLSDVEMRPSKEIWQEKNKNLEIKNFAFDITDAKNIFLIITEKGITKTKFLVISNKLSKEQEDLWKKFENNK